MFWQELWFNHLARTAPSLTVWGVPLLCLQMMAGVVPLVSLFHAVRRENGFDRLIICLTPGIFILTAGIVMPCFFGSFLGDGFSRVAELRQFLFQPQFFCYCLAACGLFWLLTLWHKRQEAARLGPEFAPGRFWAATGAELLAAVCLLALATDYFLHGGGWFLALPDLGLKWLVYGLFLVLYKCGVLAFCLVWRALFSEHSGRPRSQRQRRAASWRVKGLGWLMFAWLWQFAVVGGLRRDGDSYGWAQAVAAVLAAIGLGCLLFSFWPGKGGPKQPPDL